MWPSPQLPFPKWQILDSSKLKESADDNFKFDKSGRMFTKRVENTVGKGEIALYEQFLLFPQCFQKTYTADTKKTRACLGKDKKFLSDPAWLRIWLNFSLACDMYKSE